MARFEIAFSAKLVEGADAAQVKAAVQRLFNADDKLLAQLFSGRRMVIKQSVDQATAQKYQKAFASAGAVLEVKPLTPAPAAPAEPQRPAVSAPAAPAAGSAAPSAAGQRIQAPEFGLAPAGADLLPDKQQAAVADIDISSIELAPQGSDAGYAKPAQAPAQVSTEHLRLAD